MGREKLNESDDINKNRPSDLKESFEIGRDSNPKYANQWPCKEDGALYGFKCGMLEFFEQCKALHIEIMRAIAVGMGLSSDFFDRYVDAGDNVLRLLRYPEVEADVFKANVGQVRAGEHSVSMISN